MRLTLFGASGRTGRTLVDEALRRGHEVCAFCRPSSVWVDEISEVVPGSWDDLPVLRRALLGSQAACCVFGPRPPYRDVFCAHATEAVVSAMRAEGVERLICQTGAMVGGDPLHLSWPMRLMATLFRHQRPALAADRLRQEAVVRTSGLGWTLVKPPRLTDGPSTQ